MRKLFREFKEFAMKGNVIDLAVAVVIGAAFGRVVTAAVDILVKPIVETVTETAKALNPLSEGGGIMGSLDSGTINIEGCIHH